MSDKFDIFYDMTPLEVVEKKHLFGWCWYRHIDKQITLDEKSKKQVGFNTK